MFIKNGADKIVASNSFMTLLSVPVKHNEIQTDPFFVCKRKDSIAVLVKNDKYLLVWQHRFACDKFGWEIPQGSVEEGEKFEYSATRELYEETGYSSKQIRYLGEVYEAADWCTAKTVIFTSDIANLRSNTYELKCGWFSEDEIKGMIQDGLIFDSVTLAALQLHHFSKENS